MLRILQGDALEQLRMLPAQSAQCCITSPPYWGLRDYGTAQWEGGEEGCDHVQDEETLERQFSAASTLVGTTTRQKESAKARYQCKCGARRIDAQLGLEATPEEYIANMVAVFREVGRVLRDDGTLWLNMGDSYASSGTNGYQRLDELGERLGCGGGHKHSAQLCGRAPTPPGLKPKDLCMMPARVALALQASYSKCDECGKELSANSRRCGGCGKRGPTIYPGWYLRSDIIWHKPNPMPESVTDRPTKAHEYIFLLTKAERYFYNAEAIREENAPINGGGLACQLRGDLAHGNSEMTSKAKLPVGNYLNGRNKRTVWTIPTQPYAEAHFATFPEELPKLCILAGSKPGDTILDPFAGSGTVGKVALELGRKAVLIELNPKYVQMIKDRTSVTIGMF